MYLGLVIVSGNSNDSILNRLGEISLSDFSHLDEDHGGDLLRVELLGFTVKFNNDHGLVTNTGFYLEGPVLDFFLNLFFAELATNKSLGVKNSILRVSANLIQGRTTNKTLFICESEI
jgi:hypothetical protein